MSNTTYIIGALISALLLSSYMTMYFVSNNGLQASNIVYDKETTLYHASLMNIAEQVNSMDTTWKAGVNERWNYMGIEAIKGQMGSLQDDTPMDVVDNERNDIPTQFDSRTAWPMCQSLQEVRDQANCGSCWAFGAAEAMSDRICIASGQTRQDRISAQHLVTCCSLCGQGCNGGYPKQAWTQWKNYGIVTGNLYNDATAWCQPYSLKPCDHHTTGKYGPCPASVPTPACKKTCTNSAYKVDFDSDRHYASSVYSVSSKVSAIQTEIMTYGPVEVSFTVYEDFLTYKSGVYQHTSGSALGGHAVKMIGWGVENGTPYWTVVNSWNEGWGDNGTFKIIRGKNSCGIEGGVVAGLPKL